MDKELTDKIDRMTSKQPQKVASAVSARPVVKREAVAKQYALTVMATPVQREKLKSFLKKNHIKFGGADGCL